MSHTLNLPGPAPAPAPTIIGASAKKLRRLDDVREQVLADAVGTWDTFAARDELSYKDGRLAFHDKNGDEVRLLPTSWATGQLCARLGIPASYFRKCPAVLQDVQANFWLRNGNADSGTVNEDEAPSDTEARRSQAEGRWMLRARDETLRAVVSQRYSPLDNAELLDAIAPMLPSHLRVDWLSLEEEGLHLRLVDPHKTRDVLPDDGLSVGVHIANSEVGYRSVSVDALVYRLVCTNGLIRLVKGKSLLRQRHVHITRPRLIASLEEAVDAAWHEAEGFLVQMERTTKIPVDDVPGTIERIGNRWHLSQSVQDDLLTALRQEPARVQETVYGVVNAVTNVAQRMSAETRYDLEVLAGHLAEHGVAAYAPKRTRSGSNEPFDAVNTAQEMFEAQVVSRRSRPATSRELVEA